MATAFATVGISVGVVRVAGPSSPSWPPALSPHAYSEPEAVIATLCWRPAAMATMAVPAGMTCTGVNWFAVVPLPTCPKPLAPQAQTLPSDLRARLW